MKKPWETPELKRIYRESEVERLAELARRVAHMMPAWKVPPWMAKRILALRKALKEFGYDRNT